MKAIEFKAEGQSLKRVRNGGGEPAAGAINYVQVSVSLDDEWEPFPTVVVEFTKESGERSGGILDGGTATVPSDLKDERSYYVRLLGANEDGQVITTNKIWVRQVF